MINWKKIRRLIPKQGKKLGGKPYSTEQVRKIIEHESQLRSKALIHCLAAGGMRVGAFPELKLKDIIDYKEGCKKIIVYEGSAYEYTTFWTPEASSVFDDYVSVRKSDGEYLTPTSPAFRNVYQLGSLKAKAMSLSSIQGVVRRAVERAGLRNPTEKINGRFETMMDHGFRKRWNTIVKNTDGMKIITAEKMMGHSTPTIPLDETYNIPEDEKLFKEFRKAILELTVSDSARKQVQLDQMKDSLASQEELVQRIKAELREENKEKQEYLDSEQEKINKKK